MWGGREGGVGREGGKCGEGGREGVGEAVLRTVLTILRYRNMMQTLTELSVIL